MAVDMKELAELPQRRRDEALSQYARRSRDAEYDYAQALVAEGVALIREQYPDAATATIESSHDGMDFSVRVERITSTAGTTLYDANTDDVDAFDDLVPAEDHFAGAVEKGYQFSRRSDGYNLIDLLEVR